jgi:hypothetical protein
MKPFEGWFHAVRRDWLAVEKKKGLDAQVGHETSEAELLESYPVVWSAVVQVASERFLGEHGEVTFETPYGIPIVEEVLSGPVQIDRFELTDWKTGNDYWEVRGWTWINFEHDCYGLSHNTCSDMVSFPDNPETLFWPARNAEESIRLEYLDQLDPRQFLPLREGRPERILFPDDFLLGAVRQSVLDNPLKPADLPLQAEMFHLRAVFLEESVLPSEECVALEVWMPAEDSVFGGGVHTEQLVARRGGGRWSYDEGTSWLNAALDHGFREPLHLTGNSVEVDFSQAHLLISLFDLGYPLTRRAVMFVLDAPNRLVRAEDLPNPIADIFWEALSYTGDSYLRDGDLEYEIGEILFDLAYDDTVDAIHLELFLDALDSYVEYAAEKKVTAEREWIEIEECLHGELEKCKTEVWSEITLQFTPDAKRRTLVSRHWFEATYSQDSFDWFEAESPQGPISLRFESYTAAFWGLESSETQSPDLLTEGGDLPSVEELVDVLAMDRLGFEHRGGDGSWVDFERHFLELLTPRLMARLLIRIIREATPLDSGLGIFLSGVALDGTHPGRQIWPRQRE